MSEADPSSSNRFNRRVVFAFVLAALLLPLVLCALLALLFVPARREGRAPTPQSALVETGAAPGGSPIASPQAGSSGTPQFTRTVAPTHTPQPTSTPTPTPDPDLVNPGTHRVGADIRPGLYRGEAGENLSKSCYWARLADLSASVDAILANDNAVGQFYLEVLSSDYALETRCPIRLLHLESVTGRELPTTIAPGDYLVGIDIGPGTYRGQAGADVLTSCYWARLTNFTGDLTSIIANDNPVGQFYVEVQPGDFGLSTSCELELVE